MLQRHEAKGHLWTFLNLSIYPPKLLFLWVRWFVSRLLSECLDRVGEMISVLAHRIFRMEFNFAFI